MTKFSPNQQIQTVKSTPSPDNKQHHHHSRLQLLQEQGHGPFQQRSPSFAHQSATSTAKQTPIRGTSAVTSSSTCSSAENGIVEQPSLTDDDDDYDDDDVEIIMYNSSNGDTLSNDNKSSLGSSGTTYPISSITDTIPQQQQRPDSSSSSQSPTESKSQLLQRQLEYYFSRENLINDTYLVSQMDPDLFVPIATIAKFKRVMNITLDMDFIVSTLKHSSLVTLNDSNTMVKPNIPTQRTTVILRDVPESTDKEIEQFLAELKSPPVKNLKKEYANMWYVTFDSEEDALKMLHDSRGKLFKGQHVAARMKFEPLVGSLQKSALKTGSALSTSFNNITTSASPGQNQHTTTNYNKYYSGSNGHHYNYSNAHMNYENQQPLYYANQPDKDYSHHYANDSQRSGRFIHHNNNHHSAKGNRKGYRHNNYYNNGNIKDSAWRSRHYYWQPKSHRQPMRTIYRADHTVTSTLNRNDLYGIDSAVPLPIHLSSTSSYQHITIPSGKNTHYYKKSANCYHDQSDGKPTTHVLSSPQWRNRKHQYNRQDPSFIQPRTDDDPAPTTSINQYQGWQKDDDSTTTRHSTSSETKTDLSASSSRRSSVTTKVAAEPINSSSSNSETASTVTTTTMLSPIQSPSLATTVSLETQDAKKQQQKIKWNNKKDRNSKPRLLDSTKERSHLVKQQQPDIQSRIYFPPLPISSNVSQGAASSVTSATAVTNEQQQQQQQLQQQVSVAEIVKKGATTTVAMNYGSSNSTTHNQKTDNKAMTTSDDEVSTVAINQHQNQSEDDDPFPHLCPIQITTRPLTSLSYADMLMKNDKDINMVVV